MCIGLRVRITTSVEKPKRQSDAERMRGYRQRLKEDPQLRELLKEKDKQRNKKKRQRPKSDEERQRIRDMARLRMQKTR